MPTQYNLLKICTELSSGTSISIQTCNCTEMYRCKVQGNRFKSKDFNEFESLLNWLVSEYHALLVENAVVPFSLSFYRI